MYTVNQLLQARAGAPVKPMRALAVKTKERDGRLDVGLADKTGLIQNNKSLIGISFKNLKKKSHLFKF